mgnify:FL=1
MKKIVPVLFALVLAFSFAACKEQKTIVKGGTASLDEILAYTKEKAQEDSTNVNGKRYNINIEKFTERYNEIMFRSGGDEYLSMENWKRLGETKKDANGVEYFCYYYDIDNAELTVAVESRSHKIMNVAAALLCQSMCLLTANISTAKEYLICRLLWLLPSEATQAMMLSCLKRFLTKQPLKTKVRLLMKTIFLTLLQAKKTKITTVQCFLGIFPLPTSI